MEDIKLVCQNPWCKGHFFCKESEIKLVDEQPVYPKNCPKCISFSEELSGGVEWKDKTYEGSRWDDRPHQISYKVTNYK